MSLKPLDGFSLFKVLENCLDMELCNVMAICLFAKYGLVHRKKTNKKNPTCHGTIGAQNLRNDILETAGLIYSVSSYMELSIPVAVQRHRHLSICSILALGPLHMSQKLGLTSSAELCKLVTLAVQRLDRLPICSSWARPLTFEIWCQWGYYFEKCISESTRQIFSKLYGIV